MKDITCVLMIIDVLMFNRIVLMTMMMMMMMMMMSVWIICWYVVDHCCPISEISLTQRCPQTDDAIAVSSSGSTCSTRSSVASMPCACMGWNHPRRPWPSEATKSLCLGPQRDIEMILYIYIHRNIYIYIFTHYLNYVMYIHMIDMAVGLPS